MAIRFFSAINTTDDLITRVLGDAQSVKMAERLAIFKQDGIIFVASLFSIKSTLDPLDSEDPGDPEHPLYNIESLVSIMESDQSPFTEEEVREIESESELGKTDVRNKILKTAFSLIQYNEPSLAMEMFAMFDRVTESTIEFTQVDWPDVILYRKLYLYLLGLYPEVVSPRRMIHCLNTRFLPLALTLDIDIPYMLRSQMEEYTRVDIRKEISIDFAAAIASNESPFGIKEDGTGATVSFWIDKYHSLLEANSHDTQLAQELFGKDKDVQANNPFDQALLRQLIAVYVGTISGDLILGLGSREEFLKELKEIPQEDNTAVNDQDVKPYDQLVQKEEGVVTPDIDSHADDFDAWVSDSKTIADFSDWLKSQSTDKAERRKKLLAQLQAALDLSSDNDALIAGVAILGEQLAQQGVIDSPDLVSFNETTNSFEWIS